MKKPRRQHLNLGGKKVPLADIANALRHAVGWSLMMEAMSSGSGLVGLGGAALRLFRPSTTWWKKNGSQLLERMNAAHGQRTASKRKKT